MNVVRHASRSTGHESHSGVLPSIMLRRHFILTSSYFFVYMKLIIDINYDRTDAWQPQLLLG